MEDDPKPTKVTQALAHALSDLLGSSARETGLLLAEQIRLYRWKCSTSIIERAKRFADKRDIPTKEIPIQFLVPFIEKSSLIDDNEDLFDVWASLLVSSAEECKTIYRTYVDILSLLGPKEVSTLRRIYNIPKTYCPGAGGQGEFISISNYGVNISNRGLVEERVQNFLREKPLTTPPDGFTIIDEFQEFMRGYPIVVLHLEYPLSPTFHNKEHDMAFNLEDAQNMEAYAILERQGLCRICEISVSNPFGAWARASWVELTPVGEDLVRTCERHNEAESVTDSE